LRNASRAKFFRVEEQVHYREESLIVERSAKPIREILPTRPQKFSSAKLANPLRSLRQPDEEYVEIVEELIAKQPTVSESGWQR
jgi:hypothetical protein